jgi:protein gp37
MGQDSLIEWTRHTFNAWIGCTHAGPGCDFCYAERWDARWGNPRWGKNAQRTRTSPANWAKPKAWDKAAAAEGVRARTFCSSLADVFDPHVSILPAWRADLAALIHATPHLDWLLLTKRIGRAPKVLATMFPNGVPSHVWLGATVVNQGEWDRDVPKLVKAKHTLGLSTVFLSCEPLLGPVDPASTPGALAPGGIDWVIVGGESGPKARPMDPTWAETLLDACRREGAAFFMKQMGGRHKPFPPIPDHLMERAFPS